MGKLEKMKEKERMRKKHQIIDEQYSQKLKDLQNFYKKIEETLRNHSAQYEQKIRKNPEFRLKFSNLCNSLGIDPIITKKNIWGSYTEFYTRLGVKILKYCEKSKQINGGLISINSIVEQNNASKLNDKITREDVIATLKHLEVLGSEIKFINNEYINTSPFNLSSDIAAILKIAQNEGKVNQILIQKNLNWTEERFNNNLLELIQEGLIWKDEQTSNGIPDYYFPDIN